jgi:hypothetical protein
MDQRPLAARGVNQPDRLQILINTLREDRETPNSPPIRDTVTLKDILDKYTLTLGLQNAHLPWRVGLRPDPFYPSPARKRIGGSRRTPGGGPVLDRVGFPDSPGSDPRITQRWPASTRPLPLFSPPRETFLPSLSLPSRPSCQNYPPSPLV